MIQYRAIWRTSTIGLQWEYSFQMANDAMAIDFIGSHMAHGLEHTRALMGIDLWATEPERHVALIKLLGPTYHSET